MFEDLQGEGGRRYSGRWHQKGEPIVYLGDSIPSCMLEMLVHMEPNELPPNFKLLSVETTDASVQNLADDALPENWRDKQDLTQQVGTQWLAENSSALLRVPSALAAETWNYLLNPKHPDAGKCKIVAVDKHPWDKRLK